MKKKTTEGITRLPRGGVLLDCSRGPIQYGAVPETIKDTMTMATGVPTVFVVPPRLLSPDRAVSLAELEFPAYWNFFLKGRKVTVVCLSEQREVLTRVLSEAVFGPRVPDSREFSNAVPPSAPD
ncbi:MAG: hypothetical protein HY815_15610, partial [Candidatus Riflebacteria bacterium]|nr:hypothetical protein [Candidatus Riflebacteria bacterium]